MKIAIYWDVTWVDFVRTDVLEESIGSINMVTRISKLGTTLAVTSNRSMLQRILCMYILVFLCSMLWMLVTVKVVLSSPILVSLMMEALRSSETSVLTKDT
jgi:diacylglycerol kinase